MKKIPSILMVLFWASTISAQISLSEATQEAPAVITTSECYLLPTSFNSAYFTFTAEKDGLLYLTTSKAIKIFGEEGPLPLFDKESIQGVHAGKAYTFYNASTWGDSITMTPSFVEGSPYLPVTLVNTSQEEGSTYRTTYQEGAITFYFNVGIKAESIIATLTLPDGEIVSLNSYRVSEDYNTQGSNYILQMAETYKSLIEKEKLREGDSFKLTLSNIVSESDSENTYNGDICLTLKASSKVTELESVSLKETLQSYYMPGDEEGLITLTFTGPVTCSAPSAILAYGDREAGTWTEVEVPYTIIENTITWNVQGIHLNNVPADDEGNRYVSISLKNICDKDGYPVESNTVGTIGTILFSFLVKTMDINIYADFMPTQGSNIDAVKEIEIWISAGKYVTFDGAIISYQKDGKLTSLLIPTEQLRLEDDPYSTTDLLIYVPIEEIAFDAGEVTIELTGVSAANGTNPVIKGVFASVGKSGSHIDTIQPTASPVIATYRLDGTLETVISLKKGIYLQRKADGSVYKRLIP